MAKFNSKKHCGNYLLIALDFNFICSEHTTFEKDRTDYFLLAYSSIDFSLIKTLKYVALTNKRSVQLSPRRNGFNIFESCSQKLTPLTSEFSLQTLSSCEINATELSFATNSNFLIPLSCNTMS